MAQVAKAAGVALKTVYLAFETKSGVLRALWHLRLRGDEGPAPVGQRDWYQEVLDEPDPARQLQLNARNSREVKARAGGLMEVIRSGARADADVASLWDNIQAQFYDNQRAIVKSLAAKKALAPGLGVERGSDLLWTLNHPDVYTLLVNERGWTPNRYEQWLADATASQLLGAGR
jgi:AcrR family transcriptional regulator